MPDVVIVGGGIIGCATAYFLAEDGVSVTVLERGAIGGEASGAAAGMLAALSGEGADRGPAFAALCSDSLACYQTLLPSLVATGIEMHHHRTGVLHIALTEAQVADLRARAEKMPGGRWLEGTAIRETEPNASPKALAAYLTSDEEYIDPLRLTQAIAEAARHKGARIETGAPVTRFLRSGNRVRGVRTPRGDIAADSVVLAAGPWTKELARRLDANVPVRPVRGQMLSLSGPTTPLKHMVWGADAYLVPREDGQTYVGATVEEAGYRKHTTAAALQSLRRGAIGLIPALAKAAQRRAWAGLRPGTPDGLPIIGELPGWQNVWVATGHFRNGILLAPGSGQVLARSILAGRADLTLADFSPKRFE